MQELLGGKFGEMSTLIRILYRFSPNDYREISKIWRGKHPEDGSTLEVQDGPPEGAPVPDLPIEPQLTVPIGPEINQAMFAEVAKVFG